MGIQLWHFDGTYDYERVGKFLLEQYTPENKDGNWLQPAWEYMHAHPNLDRTSLRNIGIWEEDGVNGENGAIVGVAHYESCPGEAFFEFHPEYRHLRLAMLDYAENNLYASSNDNQKYLRVFVNDFDDELISVVKTRGYQKDDLESRMMCQYVIPDPFPVISLPDGFQLKSLADDCDWAKVHRVIWRGFNHTGEPPAGVAALEERKRLFDTPTARRDLKIAVQAPNGNFVAFCGMFYEPNNRFAYVEPVATDPDYRRMGLGKAAVLEGIRRCRLLGAAVAYVGNDLPIYRAVGFKKTYISQCWLKYFKEGSL